MGFGQIKGQRKAVYLLGRSVSKNRLHHAYIFEGPPGTGKTMTAMAFAASLNCLNPRFIRLGLKEDCGERDDESVQIADFCGECRNCKKINVGGETDEVEFPDIHVLSPEGGSRVIKIEQIRSLHSIVNYPPSEGKGRVIIIREAEKLTEEAANAFLKVLEEPPANNYFFLTVCRPRSIMRTVRSRTTVIRFSPLSAELIASMIEEKCPEASKEDIEFASSASGGSFSKALSFLTSEQKIKEVKQFLRTFVEAFSKSSGEILEFIESLQMDKDTLTDFLYFLSIFFRDVVLFAGTGDDSRLIMKGMKREIQIASRSIGFQKAYDICLMAGDGFRQIEMNVNSRKIFEWLLFSIRRDGVFIGNYL